MREGQWIAKKVTGKKKRKGYENEPCILIGSRTKANSVPTHTDSFFLLGSECILSHLVFVQFRSYYGSSPFSQLVFTNVKKSNIDPKMRLLAPCMGLAIAKRRESGGTTLGNYHKGGDVRDSIQNTIDNT